MNRCAIAVIAFAVSLFAALFAAFRVLAVFMESADKEVFWTQTLLVFALATSFCFWWIVREVTLKYGRHVI
jgi:hypothetical protein